jgi:hypothetical protein
MEILIGSSENCGYRISNDAVSRNHCKLVLQQNQLYVVDLGSTNGTYVNRQKITPQTMVAIQPDADVLLAGMVALDWQYVRRLLPGLAQPGTKYVPQEEIDRYMQQSVAPRSAPPPAPAPYQYPPQPSAPPNIIVQQSAGTPRSDLLYAVHAAKSYVGSAFLSWIMYYVGFYIVGLLLNIAYLSQASTTKKITGASPSGYDCLWLLFITHVILPIIFIFMIMAGAVHIGGMLGNMIPSFLR